MQQKYPDVGGLIDVTLHWKHKGDLKLVNKLCTFFY